MSQTSEPRGVRPALWALFAFGAVAALVTGLSAWVAAEPLSYMVDQFGWAYAIGVALVLWHNLVRPLPHATH